jgi:hypothetical protein
MPYARTQNYTNSGDFLASEVNSDFDNLWLAGEQTNRSFSQSIRKPITDSDSISMELPAAASRTNSFLTFDSTGAVSVESLSGANTPTSISRQQFTGNGSTTVFTLAANPGSAAAVVIYIDGVYQEGDTYSISGTSLTFTEAPPTNASIEVLLYRVTDIGTTTASAVSITDAGNYYTSSDVEGALQETAQSQNIVYTPAGTGAVQTTVQTKLRESVSVKDFGATGDGVTDDTAAIQAALDSGAKRISFVEGETYLVSQTGTKTIVSTANRFCLDVPSSVEIDGHFATIKLANSQNATILVNQNAGTTRDSRIKIRNLNLDGNQANQTTPATGEMPVIRLWDVTKCLLQNINVENARDYAGRFLKCTRTEFFNLNCYSSYGDGWSFGLSADSQPLVDCKIDNIHAESCLGTYGSLEGNPQLFVVQNCVVGKISGRDSGGGIKIQDASADSTFDSLLFTGNTNGTSNSGVKVQGNNGASLYPKNINIGQIVSRNAWGTGLFINHVDSVSIGSYMGFENGNGGGSGSDEYGVDICPSAGGGQERIQIGSIYSEDNGDEVSVRINGDHVSIRDIQLRDSVDVGVQITSTGRVNIGTIKHTDSGSNTTFVVKIDGNGEHNIDSIETNLAHSTSQTRVLINGQYFDVRIGSIRLGSTDSLEGVVQLTNAASSTSVTNGHTYRQYVGGSGSYFHPIIQILPFDSSARALGGYSYSVTDGSSGTGFTINHATAGSGDYVFYKILGWTVTNRASN